MKRILILTAFYLIFASNLFAQQNPQIKEAARQMANAAVKEDFTILVEYTYPKFVSMIGGKDSLISASKQIIESLNQKGIQLINVEIGEPGKVISLDSRQFCVISQTIFLRKNGNTYKATSSLLAISEDNGQHWYFISPKSNDDEILSQLFPEIKNKIFIPESGHPVLLDEPK